MSQSLAVLFGVFICFIVPLLTMAIGWYCGKYGTPRLAIVWPGRNRDDVDD